MDSKSSLLQEIISKLPDWIKSEFAIKILYVLSILDSIYRFFRAPLGYVYVAPSSNMYWPLVALFTAIYMIMLHYAIKASGEIHLRDFVTKMWMMIRSGTIEKKILASVVVIPFIIYGLYVNVSLPLERLSLTGKNVFMVVTNDPPKTTDFNNYGNHIIFKTHSDVFDGEYSDPLVKRLIDNLRLSGVLIIFGDKKRIEIAYGEQDLGDLKALAGLVTQKNDFEKLDLDFLISEMLILPKCNEIDIRVLRESLEIVAKIPKTSEKWKKSANYPVMLACLIRASYFLHEEISQFWSEDVNALDALKNAYLLRQQQVTRPIYSRIIDISYARLLSFRQDYKAAQKILSELLKLSPEDILNTDKDEKDYENKKLNGYLNLIQGDIILDEYFFVGKGLDYRGVNSLFDLYLPSGKNTPNSLGALYSRALFGLGRIGVIEYLNRTSPSFESPDVRSNPIEAFTRPLKQLKNLIVPPCVRNDAMNWIAFIEHKNEDQGPNENNDFCSQKIINKTPLSHSDAVKIPIAISARDMTTIDQLKIQILNMKPIEGEDTLIDMGVIKKLEKSETEFFGEIFIDDIFQKIQPHQIIKSDGKEVTTRDIIMIISLPNKQRLATFPLSIHGKVNLTPKIEDLTNIAVHPLSELNLKNVLVDDTIKLQVILEEVVKDKHYEINQNQIASKFEVSATVSLLNDNSTPKVYTIPLNFQNGRFNGSFTFKDIGKHEISFAVSSKLLEIDRKKIDAYPNPHNYIFNVLAGGNKKITLGVIENIKSIIPSLKENEVCAFVLLGETIGSKVDITYTLPTSGTFPMVYTQKINKTQIMYQTELTLVELTKYWVLLNPHAVYQDPLRNSGLKLDKCTMIEVQKSSDAGAHEDGFFSFYNPIPKKESGWIASGWIREDLSKEFIGKQTRSDRILKYITQFEKGK